MRREDVKEIELFPGIRAKILLYGENLMLSLVEMSPGLVAPMHSHPHEQVTSCLKGMAEVKTDEGGRVVKEGDFILFTSNERHEIKVIGDEKTVFLDVFSPPREEYIKKAEGK
ncbi:MAG: cupin domain-containing protein [Candidatus Geothermarchaeales archaeon]